MGTDLRGTHGLGSDVPGPIRVQEVELSEPLPRIANDNGRYERALVVVRLHSYPLGMVDLPLPDAGIAPEVLAQAIGRELGPAIAQHVREDGLQCGGSIPVEGMATPSLPRCLRAREQALIDAPMISVVLATRDRPDSLRTALGALLATKYPRYEIVVVDNAPKTEATAEVVATFPSVRYVREPRPGLSWARNRGIVESRGEIIAFTDDDIVVDEQWLAELARGFHCAERVGCVTGLVLPMELETPAQIWFEQYGGFGKGFQTHTYDLQSRPLGYPVFPYSIGVVGPLMACAAGLLREVGGFDPALGAGTPSGGGEDLRMLFEVIARGCKVVYNPAAIEHHGHRREYDALYRQIRAYGTGLAAYGVSLLVQRPQLLLNVNFALRLPQSIPYLLSKTSPKNVKRTSNYPRELIGLERWGLIQGPLTYLQGVRRKRAITAQFGPLDVRPQRHMAEVHAG